MNQLKEVDGYISKIKFYRNKILNELKNSDIPSRDTLIIKKYQDIIKKNANWLEEDLKNKKDDMINLSDSNEQDINSLIEKIKVRPSEKSLLLNNFLGNLVEMSENDKNVMLEILKNMTLNDLKAEINNLVNMFN